MVNEGEWFEEGDIIIEIATDKVDNEVPAPCSGRLVKILFEANDVVAVGVVIALLDVSEKMKSAKPIEVKKAASSSPVENKVKSRTSKPVRTPSAEKFSVSNSNTFFSPLIISIAKEHHISFEELARIPATGNEDRLRKSDVFQYIEDGRPFKFAQPVAQQDPTAYRIPQLRFDKGKGKVVKMDRMRPNDCRSYGIFKTYLTTCHGIH